MTVLKTMDDTKWRELCQRIMAEKDPEQLWALVEELNKTLEVREQQLRGHEGGQDKPLEKSPE